MVRFKNDSPIGRERGTSRFGSFAGSHRGGSSQLFSAALGDDLACALLGWRGEGRVVGRQELFFCVLFDFCFVLLGGPCFVLCTSLFLV